MENSRTELITSEPCWRLMIIFKSAPWTLHGVLDGWNVLEGTEDSRAERRGSTRHQRNLNLYPSRSFRIARGSDI